VGTYGNNCACELNATPEPCIIDGEDAGFFPGDACSSESSENAIAIRASEDGECVCSPQVGSVLCDDSMVSGTQCVARFSGAAGVVVHLGTDFFDNIQVGLGTRTTYRRGRTRAAHSRVVNLCHGLTTV